ncbi:alpha/beta fold hydrolase [Candidatus Woesearchaeota archaeon]|nr:alpha/beta fold hydrolase [Candidatus Woesearchaeota archaeon]
MVTFQDSQGNNIVGILSNPTGDKQKPIILLCHGFGGSKDSGTYKGMEDKLNKINISTLRFDFFGHGESTGDFRNLTISKAVDDIFCAIRYLKDNGYNKIGLFGGSFGGLASILAASKSDDLFVLALKCPVCNDMHELMCKKMGISKDVWKASGYPYKEKTLNFSFYEDSERIDGYNAAANINIPTIIIHGDKDKTVPVEQAIKTSKIIKDCTLKVFKGSGHGFEKDSHYQELQSIATDFILDHS